LNSVVANSAVLLVTKVTLSSRLTWINKRFCLDCLQHQ